MKLVAVVLMFASSLGLTTTCLADAPEIESQRLSSGFDGWKAEEKKFDGLDWTLAGLSGFGMGTATGLLGAYGGYLLAGDCAEEPGDNSLLGSCFLHGYVETMFGAALGIALGGPAGIYIYGQSSGFDGSYWAAFGGHLGGLLIGTGVNALVQSLDGENDALALASGILQVFLAQIGGTWAYRATIRRRAPEPPAIAALLDVSPGYPLRLGLPNLAWTARAGVSRVSVQLLGGRF